MNTALSSFESATCCYKTQSGLLNSIFCFSKNEKTHFFCRCELFSTDDTLHNKPVAATAKQAYDQLIANNPQLKLDADKIIPK